MLTSLGADSCWIIDAIMPYLQIHSITNHQLPLQAGSIDTLPGAYLPPGSNMSLKVSFYHPLLPLHINCLCSSHLFLCGMRQTGLQPWMYFGFPCGCLSIFLSLPCGKDMPKENQIQMLDSTNCMHLPYLSLSKHILQGTMYGVCQVP